MGEYSDTALLIDSIVMSGLFLLNIGVAITMIVQYILHFRRQIGMTFQRLKVGMDTNRHTAIIDLYSLRDANAIASLDEDIANAKTGKTSDFATTIISSFEADGTLAVDKDRTILEAGEERRRAMAAKISSEQNARSIMSAL